MSEMKTMAPSGFDRFGLNETLMRGIAAAGFDSPRPIQTEAIPAALEGHDVMGLAQTGTGKTAAFALPLLHRLLQFQDHYPRALILAPTRELATQIAAEIATLARYTKLEMVTIFGGVSAVTQRQKLRRGPEIVVGCPGRVLDLLQQGVLHLEDIETLVLDEADHMFDMGFLPTIREILAALPRQRQNLLFSATMPKEVRHLADEVLRNPHVVQLADSAPAGTIDHALVLVAEKRKRDLLEHVLNGADCNSAIVFTRTKHRARRLAEQLCKAGHRAVGLQGNLSQGQRDRAMNGFRNHQFDILVATDIVARGIDVSNVSHVINFDVPNTPEAYTHRIGRTGRAEREGIACTFVTGADYGWLRATERMIGAPIQRREVEGFEADTETAGPARASGQSRGAGQSRGPGQSRGQGGRSGQRSAGSGAGAAQQPAARRRRR
jgi:ATP-dependent RNA helicase RhlE